MAQISGNIDFKRVLPISTEIKNKNTHHTQRHITFSLNYYSKQHINLHQSLSWQMTNACGNRCGKEPSFFSALCFKAATHRPVGWGQGSGKCIMKGWKYI